MPQNGSCRLSLSLGEHKARRLPKIVQTAAQLAGTNPGNGLLSLACGTQVWNHNCTGETGRPLPIPRPLSLGTGERCE